MRPALGKLVSSFFDKKRKIPYIRLLIYLYIIRYSIVYINENCQAAIIFNNIARYLDFGTVTSKDYIFPWQSAGCSQYI